MAMAAITGGTLAWFTAEADVESTFQAGTVGISAGTTVPGTEIVIENWNPGDSEEITYTIENEGSKAIRLRVSFDGDWGNEDLNTDDPVVVVLEDEDAGWTEEDGYFYYDGEIASNSSVTLDVVVTFVGAAAGNEYQGEIYTLTAVFQAVQASYFEAEGGWSWDEIEFEEEE